MKNVGEPCAGEPHARFDGRELETEHADQGHRGGTAERETGGTQAPGPTSQPLPPRQLPTQPSSDDGGLLDIELRDDGGIRVLVGRMTYITVRPFGNDSRQVALDGLAVAYARYIISWALAISSRTNWRGSWMLGLHADGLRGVESYLYQDRLMAGRAPAFDVDEYREVTTASHLEMTQTPHAVAYRLAGRLTEALGTYQHFRNDFMPVASPDRDAA